VRHYYCAKKSLKIPKGQNPYIEEEQTTQWPKEKDKQRSTKHTHKIKDRVTRTPLKPGVNSGAPEG
jgi:flagellar motor switch/type III secretory pathway protein FliN